MIRGMEGLVVLFLLIGLVFVVAWITIGATAYARYRRKRLRRLVMRGAAPELGLTFSERHPVASVPFALRSTGDGSGVANFLSGPWAGVELTAFDAWYYRNFSEGKAPLRRYTWFTCAVTEIDASWPHLTIAPESIGSRLMDRTGIGEDLQLESEAFNRMFEVQARGSAFMTKAFNFSMQIGGPLRGLHDAFAAAAAQDPLVRAQTSRSPQDQKRFAYAFIDARMMEWLLSTGGRYRFEVLDRYLLCATEQTSELKPLLDTLVAFARQIPRAAWTLYGRPGDPVAGPASPAPEPERHAPAAVAAEPVAAPAGGDARALIRPEELPLAPDDPRIDELKKILTPEQLDHLLGG